MIVLQATIPVTADSREEMIETATELAEQSRAEDGTVDYRFTADIEEPNVFRVFEQYENEAAMNAHMESDHFETFQDRISEWVDGDIELVRFNVESTTQMI